MRGIVRYASPDHSAAERSGLDRQPSPRCSRCVTHRSRDLLPLHEGTCRRPPRPKPGPPPVPATTGYVASMGKLGGYR